MQRKYKAPNFKKGQRVMCIHSDYPDIREGIPYTVTKGNVSGSLFCVHTGHKKHWQQSYNFTLYAPNKTYEEHCQAEITFEI